MLLFRKKQGISICISSTPMDSIKSVVLSSVKVPEFDKHLKKAGAHIVRNIGKITIKMKTVVRKPLMVKLFLRNLDNLWIIRNLR